MCIRDRSGIRIYHLGRPGADGIVRLLQFTHLQSGLCTDIRAAHRRRNGPGASENPGSYHGKRQGDPAFFGQLFPVGAHFRYRSEPEILKPPRFPVKITIFAVRTFPVRTVSVYRDLRHDTRFPIESQRFLPAETTSGRSRTALQGSIVQGIERKFPKLQIRVRVAVELLSSLQDDLPGRPVCILLPI